MTPPPRPGVVRLLVADYDGTAYIELPRHTLDRMGCDELRAHADHLLAQLDTHRAPAEDHL